MIICHVCNAECDDTQELCPICGAELKKQVEENDKKEDIIIENPTLLAALEDIVSAEIFKDVLKDNGIPYSCSSEMGENTIQVLFGGGFVSEDIYVAEADLERATQIYEEFLNSQAEYDAQLDEEFFEEEN